MRSRMRWSATACRLPRSRSSAAAKLACWSRPPTACASRRTVASRLSSTKQSFRRRDSRRSKVAAPRVMFPGRLTPHLDSIGDELQLTAGYGRCRFAAECGAQDPVELSIDAGPIAYERDALSLSLLERHVVIAPLTTAQGPASRTGR